MRLEVEPLECAEMGPDELWQLAAYVFSHCKLRITLDVGDDDGEIRHVEVTRYGEAEAQRG